MKIRRLQLYDINYKPLLEGLDIFFPRTEDASIHSNCFIGINGSGKSQVLEIIAEIFLFLDALYRTQNSNVKETSPFGFRIEYEIIHNTEIHLVVIECPKSNAKKKDLIIELYKSDRTKIEIEDDCLSDFLPTKVVGYTSGDNETLSLPFDLYYDEYANYTANRALKNSKFQNAVDYEPMLYFMNYNTNLGITISSLIFDEGDATISIIKDELKLKRLVSFTITIQTNQKGAPGYKRDGSGGIKLTPELELWQEKLIKCCPKALQDERDLQHKRWILEYVLDDKTKELFLYHFSTPLELYTALYKLELLNNLIVKDEIVRRIKTGRKDRKLVLRMPMVPEDDKVLSFSELKLELNNGNVVDYLSLSDGEHQFLNVFGTISMINQPNCLFLLDEPETHFNPKWRRTFISILNKLTEGRKQDLFITSHSPFIVSDTRSQSVFIFRRNGDTVEISEPLQETYGASFDEILKMAFDIEIPISEESLNLIKEVEESDDIDYIERKIQAFGESYEISSLHRRIEFLKSLKA